MKYEIFGLRFRFNPSISIKKVVNVAGIDSDIANDDRHILLWDFDNVNLSDMTKTLKTLQRRWALPRIVIIESSVKHYHAVCIKAMPYPLVLNILASTKDIDWTYFKLGVMRGYWTLRITPKSGKDKITFVQELPSSVSEDIWALKYLKLSEYITGVI